MKQEIEIPDGYRAVNIFYDGKIRVNLVKLSPEFKKLKLGDVLTNGLQIWIRDEDGDAVILLDGKNIWLKIRRNDLGAGVRFANYDERCKFFEAIVNAGYKWNSKKYKLSKVEPKPKFKSGDIIVVENPGFGNYTILYVSGNIGGIGSLNVGGFIGINGFNRSRIFHTHKNDKFRLANKEERYNFFEAYHASGKLLFGC